MQSLPKTQSVNIWEMCLFCVLEPCVCLCVFYASFQPDSSRQQAQVPNVRVVSQSKWQGWIQKVTLLVPYMWPRSSTPLQVLVFLCVCLLGLERLLNVLVPIYSKNIGEKRGFGMLSDFRSNAKPKRLFIFILS